MTSRIVLVTGLMLSWSAVSRAQADTLKKIAIADGEVHGLGPHDASTARNVRVVSAIVVATASTMVKRLVITGDTIIDDEMGHYTIRGGTVTPVGDAPKSNEVQRGDTVFDARLTDVEIDNPRLDNAIIESVDIRKMAFVDGDVAAGYVSAGTIRDAIVSRETPVRWKNAIISPSASATVVFAGLHLAGVPIIARIHHLVVGCPADAEAQSLNVRLGCIPHPEPRITFEVPHQGIDWTVTPLPPPTSRDVPSVYVDGRTGKVDSLKTFGVGKFVRIVVANVNPFLFKYKIVAGNAQTIQEASPLNFLGLALGVSPAAPIAAPPSLELTASGNGKSLQPNDKSCALESTLLGKADAYLATVSGREYIDRALATSPDPWLALQRYHDNVAAVLDARLAAADVRTSAYWADSLARALSPSLSSYAALSTYVSQYQNRLNAVLSDFVNAGIANDSCESAQSAYQQAKADSTKAAKSYKPQAELLAQKSAFVDATAPQFSHVWSDESRFWAVLTVPRQDASSDVIVTIERETLAQPKVTPPTSQTSSPTPQDASRNAYSVNISGTLGLDMTAGAAKSSAAPGGPSGQGPGGPGGQQGNGNSPTGQTPNNQPNPGNPTASPVVPDSGYVILAQPILRYRPSAFFTVGIGAFYTPLKTPQYGVQSRRVSAPAGQPSDSIANQIVVTGNSAGRLAPAATLSVLFPTPLGDKFIPSGVLGATLLPQSSAVDFGLVAGFGAALFRSKMNVIVGAYVSTQDYLVNGYHVGDQLLTSATSAPVASHLKVAFTVGATFRVY